jgi:hypothetical protein
VIYYHDMISLILMLPTSGYSRYYWPVHLKDADTPSIEGVMS